ncbi:hypothetical protein pb186bvf_016963 [Paramecium bursaria]
MNYSFTNYLNFNQNSTFHGTIGKKIFIYYIIINFFSRQNFQLKIFLFSNL